MTDLEARLDRVLKAQAPSPRDPMFRIRVLLRRERAAFRRRLLTGLSAAAGAAVLAAVGLTIIGELVASRPLQAVAVAGVGGVLTALLAVAFAAPLPALRSIAGHWRSRALSGLRLWL